MSFPLLQISVLYTVIGLIDNNIPFEKTSWYYIVRYTRRHIVISKKKSMKKYVISEKKVTLGEPFQMCHCLSHYIMSN